MTPTLSNLQTRFKKIGKLVFISQLGPTHALAKQTAGVGFCDQSSTTDPAEEFAVNAAVVAPITTALTSTSTGDTGLTATAKTAVAKFLQTFVAANDLGLAVNAPIATVGTALAAAMTTASATVAPSGTGGTNTTGFAMYFATNFGIVLPQNSSPSIPDSYIASAVV